MQKFDPGISTFTKPISKHFPKFHTTDRPTNLSDPYSDHKYIYSYLQIWLNYCLHSEEKDNKSLDKPSNTWYKNLKGR